MPAPRYTIRLPEPLNTLVQEHILTTRTPFAVLIREALSAYLADTVPTATPAPADSADTVRELQMQLAALTLRVEIVEQRQPLLPTAADRADTLRELQAHLADVTTRVKVIEEILTRWPQLADRSTDTAADIFADRAPTEAAGSRQRGRPRGLLRQRILTLLREHPEGLRAEEIRVYLQADKPIGDTLQGMRKGGVIAAQGHGQARRYVVVETPEP
jgi:hypothetical protein